MALVELYEGNPAAALELARRGGEPGRFAEASALLALGRLEEAEAALHGLLRDGRESREWQRLTVNIGLAEVALAGDNRGRALALVEGILPLLGGSNILDDMSPAYLICYEVLRACGDARAAGVLEQGGQWLERQASTLDGPARERFVTNIPSRRRLAAAWHVARTRG